MTDSGTAPVSRFSGLLGRALLARVLGILVAVQIAFGCEKSDDERQIRTLVENGVLAAEKHGISDLMGLTTKEFVALPGHKNRREVKGMLFIAFRKYGKLTIEMPRPTVNIDKSGKYAEVDTPFVIVRKGSPIPDLADLYNDPESWTKGVDKMADLYDLHLWLIKKDNKWVVRQARLSGFNRLEDL